MGMTIIGGMTITGGMSLASPPPVLNYSVAYDGSGDAITFGANSANLAIGDQDFTWEAFIYFNSVPSTEIDIFESQTTNTLRILKRGSSSGLSVDFYGGTSYLIKSDATITTGVWHHVAVTRSSGSLFTYFDGLRTSGPFFVPTTGATPTVAYGVGGRATGANSLNGYISNMRLTTGSLGQEAVLYSGATYTVPTSQLTTNVGPYGAVVNLLICQSSTLKDNSANNYTITAVGNAAVNSLNPFS